VTRCAGIGVCTVNFLLVVYVAICPEPSRIWSRTTFSIELSG